jgi:uncharacterized protein (TIGR03437 family)
LCCGLFLFIALSPLEAQITEYPVSFNGLSGIAAGPDGAMWFSGNGHVGRITTAGVVTTYQVPTSNDTSYSITAGPDGAMWFTESPLNSPASNGGPFAKIGRITTAGVITEYTLPDPNSIPSAITAGPDGALWFIESGNSKIGRITTSGAVTEIPLPASVVPYGAYGIAAGPDGALWFTEYYGGNGIVRLTTAGVFTVYQISTTVNAGSLGITAGPDGAMWFADESPNPGKIGRITTAGVITEYPLTAANDVPFAIGSGPDGALWFTSFAGQIGRITTSGSVTAEVPTPTNTANGFLGYIAAGPDGAMWFTEVGGKIGRIPAATSAPPTITEVDNAFSNIANSTIQSGTWVAIKGTNLSKTSPGRGWNANENFPASMDGTSVTINGKPAFVYYISPSQVNVQAPTDSALGPVSVVVTNNGANSAAATATYQTNSPALLQWGGGQYPYALITNGATYIGKASVVPGTVSAHAGDSLTLWATGLGPTNPPLPAGQQPTTFPPVTTTPTVTVGGINATVLGAVLRYAGLYQVNVQLPASLATGDLPIKVIQGSFQSPDGILINVQP